jgi:hypothetical protein
MKMRKMEETNSIDLRFIETIDEKSGKKEIEELLRSERVEDPTEKLLDEMLRFIAEIPIDKHHDYRTFRHSGLRGYLINRFLRERAYIVRECETLTRA